MIGRGRRYGRKARGRLERRRLRRRDRGSVGDSQAVPARGEGAPGPPIHCSPREVEVLKALASSTSAGVWRIKRAKIILGTLDGQGVDRLMRDVRVPARTIAAFQRRFAAEGMRVFDRPDRRATKREAAVERMLAFLENPPPEGSPQWTALTVHYIGREYNAKEISDLRALIRARPDLTRAGLARELCELVGLRQPSGKLRLSAATDALKRMDMDNVVTLPPLQKRAPRRRRRLLGDLPVAPPNEPVDGQAIAGLRFVPVEGEGASLLWRELLLRYHYIETPRLFGAQLRYLVYATGPDAATGQAVAESDRAGGPGADSSARSTAADGDALLAVLGFAAAAWRLTARDEFIGWTDDQRVRNLKLVVSNARFLILPWVRVKNPATRILGGIARQLPLDWQARYGYKPVLLETFVQLDRFKGTCYRAANWICVGKTRGYSLHGWEHRESAPERAIFLYPLRKDFRRVLCGPLRPGREGASGGGAKAG